MFKFHREKRDSSGSDLAVRMSEYLDCECFVVMPGEDDEKLAELYREAEEREDVFPIFVRVDATLMESLLLNSDPADADEDGEEYELSDPEYDIISGEEEAQQDDAGAWKFRLSKIRAYRENSLAEDLADGAAYLEELRLQRSGNSGGQTGRCEEQSGKKGRFHFFEDRLNENIVMTGRSARELPEKNSREDEARKRRPELTVTDLKNLHSFWETGTGLVSEMLLALIPVREPWQVFAWLPFGGWNDCPGAEEMMAVAKYWYEKYGAVPVALNHDELEFLLPHSLNASQAAEAAEEHVLFCPDLLNPEGGLNEEKLAKILSRSRCWYFWWD